MKIESFTENLDFDANKIVSKVILESAFSKEIRILLTQGQVMKKHMAPFPIVIHVLDGAIDFGVHDEVFLLKKGDIITLAENTPHDLSALKNSSVRLTLSKFDKAERVEKAVKNS